MLHLDSITKSYPTPVGPLSVLHGISLHVAQGDVVALVGASGSGKTTLLQIAGLLDLPTSGTVRLCGQDVSTADDATRTRLRGQHIGFVYQFHHLLPEFTALENAIMPLVLAGIPRNEAEARALPLLEQLGLAARAHHRPAELSGGEQQRCAIARALIHQPKLLLADEPTGNLDTHTSDTVFALLLEQAARQGTAMLIVTHNELLAARCHRIIRLVDGRLSTPAQAA